MLDSIANAFMPGPDYSSSLGWFVLLIFGFLAFLALLAFIVAIIYLVRAKDGKSKAELSPSPSEYSPWKQAFLYFFQFVSSSLMFVSLAWLLELLVFIVVYAVSYYDISKITSTVAGLETSTLFWLFIFPYITFLVSLPVSFLICFAGWRQIRVSDGENRQRLVRAKRTFTLVQLFLTAVFLVLFSGLLGLTLVVTLLLSGSGIYGEEFFGCLLFLSPALVSFFAGAVYLVELLLLRCLEVHE